jgi:phage terminase large subunit
MATIELDLNKINRAYYGALRDKSRHQMLMGGAGSGKSYYCADKEIFRCITEPGHKFLTVRKVARTLRRSVWELLKERISYWGLVGLCNMNKTELTIDFDNGSTIWCGGMDDPEKIKSIQGLSSIWVEEATEMTEADLSQLNLRLRGHTASYKQIMYSFNPISVKHHIKRRFYDKPPDSCFHLHTTYKDNEYIDDDYKQEMEQLINHSQNLYRIYVLGEWGVLEGAIYNNIVEIKEFPAQFSSECYAIDFGYNHPMAVLHIGEIDDEYFVKEKIYQSGMTIKDLVAKLKTLDVPAGALIQCDSARPEAIEELNREGFYNAVACPKGPGSVQDGIDYCQSKTIYTHPDNVNFNKEHASYAWRKDKDGNPMDEPVKAYDDAMDAMRYGMWGTWGKPSFELEVIDRKHLGF